LHFFIGFEVPSGRPKLLLVLGSNTLLIIERVNVSKGKGSIAPTITRKTGKR